MTFIGFVPAIALQALTPNRVKSTKKQPGLVVITFFQQPRVLLLKRDGAWWILNLEIEFCFFLPRFFQPVVGRIIAANSLALRSLISQQTVTRPIAAAFRARQPRYARCRQPQTSVLAYLPLFVRRRKTEAEIRKIKHGNAFCLSS